MDRVEKYARAICTAYGYDPDIMARDIFSMIDGPRWKLYTEEATLVMDIADDERAEAYAEGHDDGIAFAREYYSRNK